MIKQMLKKVIVLEGNDTGLSAGQTLSLARMNEINDRVLDEGKVPAKFGPMLLGISKSAVETDSFLSAASFQETTRVLTDAAVRGKIDKLDGLKENVIIGKLIPAGTGRRFDRETTRKIEERAAELTAEREEKARLLEEEKQAKLPEEVLGKQELPAEEIPEPEVPADDFI
jgi:DNA-directed RNA polymerase subunit beta'